MSINRIWKLFSKFLAKHFWKEKQSEALCEAVIKKKGKADIYLYPYYTHAFFNQNKSDAFEDVTIKTYKFVENVFKK